MMDKVATSFLDNVCRLCTGKTDGVSIYSEEGKRHGLRDKIRKFLAIDVTEEDVLPKMVCSVCTSKLDGMDEFASMAAQTQAKLLECIGGLVDVAEDVEELGGDWTTPQLEGLEDRLNTEKRHRLLPPLTENGAAVVDEPNNGEDMQGSLLHSILTKGQNQSSEVVESTGGVTELEVRVDPMLFLCDQEDMEEPPSVNNNNNHSNDDSPPSPRTSTSDESTANSSDPERDAPRLALESKMRQCGLCPRSFYTELSLQSHMWQHVPFATARKMIVPPEQNGFQMHTNLYRHKLYHSSSQCLCQVCGRVYPTRSTLRAHQITHSNLRPHKCSLCDKTFKRNQDLKFHINQHTGERPYRCPYCPKAFASSGNCFSHRKRMHPKQLARDKNKLLSTRH